MPSPSIDDHDSLSIGILRCLLPGKQSIVAYRHTMRVTTQVTDHLTCASKGLLDVNMPELFVHFVFRRIKGLGRAQIPAVLVTKKGRCTNPTIFRQAMLPFILLPFPTQLCRILPLSCRCCTRPGWNSLCNFVPKNYGYGQRKISK
jgi:CheY-like chemotaxis protein